MKKILILLLLTVSLSGICQKAVDSKPRTIITTDGEIDDVVSMILFQKVILLLFCISLM